MAKLKKDTGERLIEACRRIRDNMRYVKAGGRSYPKEKLLEVRGVLNEYRDVFEAAGEMELHADLERLTEEQERRREEGETVASELDVLHAENKRLLAEFNIKMKALENAGCEDAEREQLWMRHNHALNLYKRTAEGVEHASGEGCGTGEDFKIDREALTVMRQINWETRELLICVGKALKSAEQRSHPTPCRP